MKKLIALLLLLTLVLCLFGCAALQQYGKTQEPTTEQGGALINKGDPTAETTRAYSYEELSEMTAEELLDLFVQNGLVINDDLKASFTEEEIQILFKAQFDLWHRGVSVMSHTMYMDLAEKTKEIYDKITEPKN